MRGIAVTKDEEISALRAALSRFGSHVGNCPHNLCQPECDFQMACTCGFAEALRGGSRQPAAVNEVRND